MHKKHALTFVTITVFLDTVGFGIIVPILPEFLVLIGDISLSEASALSGYLIFSYAVWKKSVRMVAMPLAVEPPK